MKPRITKCPTTGAYFCAGWLSFGVGMTPEIAYAEMENNEKTVKARLKLPRPEPVAGKERLPGALRVVTS